VELNLTMSSTAEDTDWIASFLDEAPDGSSRELTKAMLRSSHRAIDEAQSRPAEPWHPHEVATPLTPGRPEQLAIGLGVVCNVFAPGHRLRLELSNCESSAALVEQARVLRTPATNTVLTGRDLTRLMLPIVRS
jgi:predicted acyl esterase